MRTYPFRRFIVQLAGLLFITFLMAGTASASPISEAQGRMKERLSAIDSLKEEGLVGENAKGFLSVRGDLGARQRSLVDGENADRRTIYAAVAAKTGQSVDAVGAQRAIRIAELAEPGLWLEKPSGEWFRKP